MRAMDKSATKRSRTDGFRSVADVLIVGLNLAHDAGVAVVDSGKTVALLQRERFTRNKRQAFLTAEFIDWALKQAGVDWRDVDHVAISSVQSWEFVLLDPSRFRVEHDLSVAGSIPLRGLGPDVFSGAQAKLAAKTAEAKDWASHLSNERHPYAEYFGDDLKNSAQGFEIVPSIDWLVRPATFSDPPTAENLRKWCGARATLADYSFGYSPIRVTLDGVAKPGVMVSYHLAHAASAYYPFATDEALIYTLDNGDGFVRRSGYTGGIYAYGKGNRLATIGCAYHFHAHFFQRVGERLNLGHGGAAGKLMGLAPYGDPHFFDDSMIGTGFDVFGPAFAYGAKDSRYQVLDPLRKIFEERRAAVYGDGPEPCVHHRPGAYGAQDMRKPGVDLAATAQTLFQETAVWAIGSFKGAMQEAGATVPDLCLAGGGALNCPANSLIWQQGRFDRVLIPPFCDDSGLALGAALALAHDVFDETRQPIAAEDGQAAYLGLAHSDKTLEDALAAHRGSVIETHVEDAARAAATDLASGRRIAWFEGRSEVGPRALGHRSILADPRQPETWWEVNQLKEREYWRPFAPAVLAEKAGDWFEGAPVSSPFMLFNAQVRSTDLPAITHVDGSARIQTVDASCGEFRRVVEAFEARTGVPVVLNTSFNGPGEPIVETPEDALAFLERTPIDAVFINGRRFSRADPHSGTDTDPSTVSRPPGSTDPS
jgi:carbamoyltransferase